MRVTGAKIKQFREGQGLTTAQLAAKIHPQVTRQAVEYWERNGVGAFRTLTKIATALEINPALLLDSDNAN